MDVKTHRLDLLDHGIALAKKEREDWDRMHRLDRARLDVLLDTVLPRTEEAFEEVRLMVLISQGKIVPQR